MTRTLLRDVRVYRDGVFGDPEDLAVEDGLIAADTTSDGDVAAVGGYLVPGLIDCHVHLSGRHTLELLAAHGVTTGLDMSSPAPLVDSLRGLAGLTDIRSPLIAAMSPDSAHGQRMRDVPGAAEGVVTGPGDAEAWVQRHVDQGADYLKVVVDLPGFDQETVDAIVAAAHERGRLVVAHASALAAVDMAQRAGVDILTHAPLDRPVGAEQAAELAAAGTVVSPTLTMMKGIVDRLGGAPGRGPSYAAAQESVRTLHAAGVPIAAGTDANEAPSAPASPAFGTSLHEELSLLVEAGLTPAQALDAATSVAADHVGLTDRGRIRPGLRADLLLLDADPTVDITATRSIRGVWCAGQRVAAAS